MKACMLQIVPEASAYKVEVSYEKLIKKLEKGAVPLVLSRRVNTNEFNSPCTPGSLEPPILLYRMFGRTD
jgi:hypothetical protein